LAFLYFEEVVRWEVRKGGKKGKKTTGDDSSVLFVFCPLRKKRECVCVWVVL